MLEYCIFIPPAHGFIILPLQPPIHPTSPHPSVNSQCEEDLANCGC